MHFRRFLGLLACAVAVVSGARAAEAVQFEASRGYTDANVMLRGALHRPGGAGPFPAVVLMHGCGGWQPAVRYSLTEYADRFVRDGFVVLLLDSFGPRNLGGGKVCEDVALQQDALDYRTHDAYDALRYLQAQPYVDPGSVFLMGQSNGGSVAINVAKGDASAQARSPAPGYRAVVAFYPWCGSFEGRHVVKLAAPLLVFGGARDDWVPASECAGIRSEGAELRFVVYPNAGHSFDVEMPPQRYLGYLVGKDPDAAQDSRRRMTAFFRRYLQAPPAGIAAD